MFWLAALAILAIAGLVLAWPLLARGSEWRATGLAVLLLLPIGGALLYRDFGTPAAIDLAPAPVDQNDFNAMADDLAGRLSERPEDLEGWLLLGRSMKSLQRYDDAVEALETARRIAPDNPLVQVELAEAMLFASGDPRIGEEVRQMLRSAVAVEPGLQKGLWLLGLDAAQRGADTEAVDYWERLLRQVEPGTPVAESVREQIELAQARLGGEPAPQGETEGAWPGIEVHVTIADEATLPQPLPNSAVLFVIARAAGSDARPPLGVARIEQPSFPVTVTMNDGNAMLPQRKLSEQSTLNLHARLSLSGEPGASSGDWESASLEVSTQSEAAAELTLQSAVD